MRLRLLLGASALVAGATLILADAALAGPPATPAPVAGVGIGAVALLGVAHRVLKSRTGR
jgi:hypothetical protein